jgi:PBP1b-binding outer membrane lipoprotein LpoB
MKTLGIITAAILVLAACSDGSNVAPVEPTPAPVEPAPVEPAPVEPTPVPDPENVPTDPVVVPPIELGDEPVR